MIDSAECQPGQEASSDRFRVQEQRAEGKRECMTLLGGVVITESSALDSLPGSAMSSRPYMSHMLGQDAADRPATARPAPVRFGNVGHRADPIP